MLDKEIIRKSGNTTIFDSFIKADDVINNSGYERIICSISGGADSDIVLDIMEKVRGDRKIHYVFFDTGLEYKATKRHITYLEDRYGIDIHTIRPYKSIPVSCRDHGQPFLSKMVSENISRLQVRDFQWEDEPYEVLTERYDNCSSALRWWTNSFPPRDNGRGSRFNISSNSLLKEFMLENPPWFKISNKCCHYTKKLVAREAISSIKADLDIFGVRKYENGARQMAYSSCFTTGKGKTDEYRPIFWYTDADKRAYEDTYDIVHSDCYGVYGLDRTGCCGCPFGRSWEKELDIMEQYEPPLYKAASIIFADAYKYSKMYREFRERMGG